MQKKGLGRRKSRIVFNRFFCTSVHATHAHLLCNPHVLECYETMRRKLVVTVCEHTDRTTIKRQNLHLLCPCTSSRHAGGCTYVQGLFQILRIRVENLREGSNRGPSVGQSSQTIIELQDRWPGFLLHRSTISTCTCLLLRPSLPHSTAWPSRSKEMMN